MLGKKKGKCPAQSKNLILINRFSSSEVPLVNQIGCTFCSPLLFIKLGLLRVYA